MSESMRRPIGGRARIFKQHPFLQSSVFYFCKANISLFLDPIRKFSALAPEKIRIGEILS